MLHELHFEIIVCALERTREKGKRNSITLASIWKRFNNFIILTGEWAGCCIRLISDFTEWSIQISIQQNKRLEYSCMLHIFIDGFLFDRRQFLCLCIRNIEILCKVAVNASMHRISLVVVIKQSCINNDETISMSG